MANTPDKVISVATAEVGYLEKSNTSNLYDKTAGASSGNYTKYWAELTSGMQGQAWCQAFVDWCFMKAYGMNKAKELLKQPVWNYYTPTCANYFIKAGQWYISPKVGDLIYFKNSTRICHVGLVYKVDASTVYTIEGNTSGGSQVIANGGGVCKKSYKLTNSRIAGYGRPKYDASTTTTTTTPTQVVSTNKQIKNVVKVGDYLNVRKAPEGDVVRRLSNGAEITIYDYKDGWYKIGNQQWVSADYIITAKGKVKASQLNIREGYNAVFKKLGELKSNDTVKVLNESNGWYQILSADKIFGWVSGQYIEII